MNQAGAVALAQEGLQMGVMVLLPILAVCLFLGLMISIFQALTQIQEQTLSFLPKLIGIGVVGALMGNWMLGTIVSFTHMCLERVANVGAGF